MTAAETCQELFLTLVSACWGVCMHAAVSVDFYAMWPKIFVCMHLSCCVHVD